MESVIIDFTDACVQVTELCKNYFGLIVTTCQPEKIVLEGSITVNHRVDSYTLYKKYKVKIDIFPNSSNLPEIYETGGVICDYPHQYVDGKLCLETDAYIKWYFRDGFELITWMDKFVIPYFISYEFYDKYGVFPFGDREHGDLGIIQSYQDIFHVQDLTTTLNVMYYIVNNRYRGHALCPCQSGRKLRVCHGRYLLPFYQNRELYNMICDDVENISAHCQRRAER